MPPTTGAPARHPSGEPAPNPLSGVPLDRASERRTDAGWFAAVLADPATRVVPVSEGRVLVAGAADGSADGAADAPAWAPTIPIGRLRQATGGGEPWAAGDGAVVLLGVARDGGGGGEVSYVAAEVAPADAAAVAALAGARPDVRPGARPGIRSDVRHGRAPGAGGAGARWSELRPAAAALPAPDAALAAYARGMVWWHGRHRFCGVCGGPTASADAGHVRRCTRCDARHFPRTDPAVIVLVADAAPDGDPAGEACLLGSAPGWPDGMYSTLAGFVEPGESLEEAVRREVWEEAGVRVAAARYDSSQPWPFPQSLMLGFTARAEPGAARGAVRVDGVELRDARWFTRAELDAALAAGRVRLPSPLSIARRLIDGWRGGASAGAGG